MRAWRMVAAAVPLVVVLVAGCTGGAAQSGVSAGPSSGIAATGSASASVSSVVPGASVGPRPEVTVPSLGGVVPSAAESSAVASGVPESSVAAGVEVSTGQPSEPATPTSVTAPATVPVELVGCDDCQVLASAAAVTGTYAAALISQGGRANLLSLDLSGSVVGIVNILYGATFVAPADGRLACGAGGRCVVVAAQPDGRAILSAYQLADNGGWLDLSGSSGFVSATAKGLPVLLEDTYGVAIQVSNGTSTVWTVLNWNGSIYGSIGCAPDGETPDLTLLDRGLCLS